MKSINEIRDKGLDFLCVHLHVVHLHWSPGRSGKASLVHKLTSGSSERTGWIWLRSRSNLWSEQRPCVLSMTNRGGQVSRETWVGFANLVIKKIIRKKCLACAKMV